MITDTASHAIDARYISVRSKHGQAWVSVTKLLHPANVIPMMMRAQYAREPKFSLLEQAQNRQVLARINDQRFARTVAPDQVRVIVRQAGDRLYFHGAKGTKLLPIMPV